MIPSICGNYKNASATGVLTANPGTMTGFYVNSTSSGTVVFRDGGSAGTVMNGTITPAIGWHFFPVAFGKAGGLHLTVGSTIDITVVYQPASTA